MSPSDGLQRHCARQKSVQSGDGNGSADHQCGGSCLLVKNKNNTLANETAFTVFDLTGERDSDAIKDCQNIHDLANTDLASLGAYGITAAKLTALQANIDGFKAIVTNRATTSWRAQRSRRN